jgi:hypothetical protein
VANLTIALNGFLEDTLNVCGQPLSELGTSSLQFCLSSVLLDVLHIPGSKIKEVVEKYNSYNIQQTCASFSSARSSSKILSWRLEEGISLKCHFREIHTTVSRCALFKRGRVQAPAWATRWRPECSWRPCGVQRGAPPSALHESQQPPALCSWPATASRTTRATGARRSISLMSV